MDDGTQTYLAGRFGDYYRGSLSPPDAVGDRFRHEEPILPPPAADRREWGFVTWNGPMVRHRSLLDLGSLDGWLAEETPRHVYHSVARYERPSAPAMTDKGWIGADLVFDLDADHLRDVEPDDSYRSMLAACKDALIRLLDFLENDFGFEQLDVVFSGGRGYHVHVRDDSVQDLDSDGRREIVDYVRGVGFDAELALAGETAGGDYGRESPAELRRLGPGAWSDRIRDYVVDFAEEVAEMEEGAAVERLTAFDGVGEGKAATIREVCRDRRDALAAGNLDVAGGLKGFWRQLVERAVEETGAETDEPVTTDTRRLIRLPGSLHGGTGFRVVPLDREALDDFRPLHDALVFSDREQEVTLEDPTEIYLAGRKLDLTPGTHALPEHTAVFLMLREGASLG